MGGERGSPRRPEARPARRRRVAAIVAIGIAGVLVILGIGVAASRTAQPTTPTSLDCGWDLSDAEAQRANHEYLTATMSWMVDHPGQVAPPPTSPYWHGECPLPTGAPIGPPEDEHDAPDE